MERADLSENGAQRLEVEEDHWMSASRVFKKRTYLNLSGRLTYTVPKSHKQFASKVSISIKMFVTVLPKMS